MSEDLNSDIDTRLKSVYRWLFLAGLFVIALGGVVLTQTPGQGGPMVVLVFLLCIFVITLSTSMATLLRLLKTPKQGYFFRNFYISLSISTGAVYLVGLQTLRQLQAIDILLVCMFELLINFYLIRRL